MPIVLAEMMMMIQLRFSKDVDSLGGGTWKCASSEAGAPSLCKYSQVLWNCGNVMLWKAREVSLYLSPGGTRRITSS